MMTPKSRVSSCKTMYEEDPFFLVDAIDLYEKLLWFASDTPFQEAFTAPTALYPFTAAKA